MLAIYLNHILILLVVASLQCQNFVVKNQKSNRISAKHLDLYIMIFLEIYELDTKLFCNEPNRITKVAR